MFSRDVYDICSEYHTKYKNWLCERSADFQMLERVLRMINLKLYLFSFVRNMERLIA